MNELRLPNSIALRHKFQRLHYVVVPRLLPPRVVRQWRQEAERMTCYAREIRRKNDGMTLVYRVVTGDIIQEKWPELFAFYNDSEMLDWVKAITGERSIFISPHLQSAVNLNLMDNVQSVYRWHFDAVAYTALLYLTNVEPKDGGALELVANCRPHKAPPETQTRRVQLWPAAGTLVLMDGTRCYHRVAQLLRPSIRLSIPLVYPNTRHPVRDKGLDSYLYEANKKSGLAAAR
jgi:hypothetical protein